MEQKQTNIRRFDNYKDMKFVLAHEFGHVLGIGHVKDDKALMHEWKKEQNADNIILTRDDINALKKAAIFDNPCRQDALRNCAYR